MGAHPSGMSKPKALQISTWAPTNGCDELEPALVLNAADGTHLGEDVFNGRELGPQVLVLLVDRADV